MRGREGRALDSHGVDVSYWGMRARNYWWNLLDGWLSLGAPGSAEAIDLSPKLDWVLGSSCASSRDLGLSGGAS